MLGDKVALGFCRVVPFCPSIGGLDRFNTTRGSETNEAIFQKSVIQLGSAYA